MLGHSGRCRETCSFSEKEHWIETTANFGGPPDSPFSLLLLKGARIETCADSRPQRECCGLKRVLPVGDELELRG